MFKSIIIAHAAALMLLVSACAGPRWVLPADHPADPDGRPGIKTSSTALKRYRETTTAPAATSAPKSESGPVSESEQDSHRNHEDQDDKP
jgi:hypothetical protein